MEHSVFCFPNFSIFGFEKHFPVYYTVQKEKSPLYSTFCSQWLPASYSSHSPAGFSFANYKAMQEQDAFLILFIISIYLLIYFWR